MKTAHEGRRLVLSVPLIVFYLSAGGALALGTLMAASALLPAARHSRPPEPEMATGQGTWFLFRGTELVDASPEAIALLGPAQEDSWAALMERLSPDFPGLGRDLAMGRVTGAVITRVANTPAGPLELRLRQSEGLCRVDLAGASGAPPPAVSHRMLASIRQEAGAQREVLEGLPVLAWREDAAGCVIWANTAYMDTLPDTGAEALPWPLPRLFEAAPRPPGHPPARRRVSLQGADGTPLWFDLHTRPGEGGTTLCYAMPADGEVRAEEALRNFVQTLTKTFAHLPIGLAIFDRNRQLALFNPALSELTTLEPDWLIGRPTLHAVLDRLRDRGRIPEPRDYATWRMQLAELEDAAASDGYQETWSLPSGQTFRVSGRQHPEGAIAFLFEDITAAITLRRNFRSELDRWQNVLDALPQGLAVFSADGRLALANGAYRQFWGPASGVAGADIAAESRRWQEASTPTPVWGEVRDFVAQFDDRSAWEAEVLQAEGGIVACRFVPLPGGASLCAFEFPDQSVATAPASPRARSVQAGI